MKNTILTIIVGLFVYTANGQSTFSEKLNQTFKFSTFYGAVNGGNSISATEVFSVTDGLQTEIVETPFDYSMTMGVRKLRRMGYENRERKFYNGTEKSFSDAATIGRWENKLEYLFEVDYARQQGIELLNQQHFIRYVGDKYIVKAEYLEDGFADVKYAEMSQRFRKKIGKKGSLSINAGIMQRVSEPYGYNPLDDWLLENGNLHYTTLALEEGYTIEFADGGQQYYDPNGNLVAENTEVWEALVIPQVLSDYTNRKRNELPNQWTYSAVIGFDFYHYTNDFWLHSWANLIPYHLDLGGEYTYGQFVGQGWIDYSGGLIFGYYFIPKKFGIFIEGKYNKYWNRNWHDFSVGINYSIF